MIINLSILLIPYFIFLAVWAIFGLVSIYHMLRYGFKSFVTPLAIIIYCVVAFFILSTSLMYLQGFDWSQELFVLNLNLSPDNINF